MNERGAGPELLESFDKLSLGSLSKSSPSNIQPFQLKSTRTIPPPLPNTPLEKNKRKHIYSLKNDPNLTNKFQLASNLSHVPCKFFKQGTCTAGANCIFSHNPDPTSGSSVCKYFRKGNCKFGTKCALLHTMSPFSTSSVTSNSSSSSSKNTTTTNTRFLFDQFGTSHESKSHHDPFISSAPSPSPFSMMLLDERRHPSNDLLSTSNHSFNANNNNRSFYSTNGINIHHNNTSMQPLHSIPESTNNHRYRMEQENMNDFMLPSSLNDLLTPNELRQQQQYPLHSNNGPSFELSSSNWNHVPFYNTNNTSHYSYDDASPPTATRYPIHFNQQDQQEEEEGPFIMDDCIETHTKIDNKNIENYSFLTF